MWKLNLSNNERSSLKSESDDCNRPESPLSWTSSVLDRIRFRSDDENETSSDSERSRNDAPPILMPNIPTIGHTPTRPIGKIQRSSDLVIIEQAIINQVLDESKLDITINTRKRTKSPGTSKLRFSNWCQLNFIKSYFENLFKRPLELPYSRTLPPPPPTNRRTAAQRTNEPRPPS